MSKWSEYYQSRLGNSYMNYCRVAYMPFVNAILDRLSHYPIVREEGCGIATFSKIIAFENNGIGHYYAFDNDPAQCINAMSNVAHLPISVNVYCANILWKQPQEVDIIFSHGVLEHFEDKDIKQILDRQRKDAKCVIHYVPTDGYDKPSFGDERLMLVEWWLSNFNPTQHIVFNDGKDLVLIWEE